MKNKNEGKSIIKKTHEKKEAHRPKIWGQKNGHPPTYAHNPYNTRF